MAFIVSKPNNNQEMLNINEIAHLLGKSVVTIRNWVKKEIIPYHQIMKGSPLLFEKKIIENWWNKKGSTGK